MKNVILGKNRIDKAVHACLGEIIEVWFGKVRRVDGIVWSKVDVIIPAVCVEGFIENPEVFERVACDIDHF